MKRKLALFMVLAMLVSLVPMNVFAASTNTAVSTPTVTKDNYTTSTLRIAEANALDWAANTTKSFELQLTNGEFSQGVTTATINIVHNSGKRDRTAGAGRVIVSRKSDGYASVTMVTPTAATTSGAKMYFDIPLGFKATGGEVTVKIDPREAPVTGGNVILANGVTGATNVTVGSVKTFADTFTLDTVKIDETTIGTVGILTATLELKLPAGFEWSTSSFAISSAGAWNLSSTSAVLHINSSDKRIATFEADAIGGSASTTQRGTMYLTNLKAKRTSDAKMGDVTMNFRETTTRNYYTEQSVIVGKYTSYDVTVKAVGDPLTVYAGKYDSTASQVGNTNDNKVQRLSIKEEVTNSWLINRITKIQFNDEVKVLGYKIHKRDNITAGTMTADGTSTNIATAGIDSWNSTTATNKSYVEISTGTISSGNKGEMEIDFYVSVKPNYTGDITATVNGTALTKESKVVLGKAVAPAAVTVAVKDLKLGLQNQAVGDIVVTEPAKGVWDAKSDSTKVMKLIFDDGAINAKGTATVTKGDVVLGTLSSSGAELSIPLKYASTVASEITVKGLTLDLNRSIPEGKFEVGVGGNAIAQNYLAAETAGTFNKKTAASVLAFNIITPADANTKTIAKVVFTIGAKEYKVGDTAVTADVAPMIDSNNRTLLPLRALANALNVSNESIVWNEADRSVTIFKGESIVKVVIGQSQFIKNGVVIPMDTQAVIIDGRTMMPLRAVGQALGFTPVWDEATKTVTIQ